MGIPEGPFLSMASRGFLTSSFLREWMASHFVNGPQGFVHARYTGAHQSSLCSVTLGVAMNGEEGEQSLVSDRLSLSVAFIIPGHRTNPGVALQEAFSGAPELCRRSRFTDLKYCACSAA